MREFIKFLCKFINTSFVSIFFLKFAIETMKKKWIQNKNSFSKNSYDFLKEGRSWPPTALFIFKTFQNLVQNLRDLATRIFSHLFFHHIIPAYKGRKKIINSKINLSPFILWTNQCNSEDVDFPCDGIITPTKKKMPTSVGCPPCPLPFITKHKRLLEAKPNKLPPSVESLKRKAFLLRSPCQSLRHGGHELTLLPLHGKVFSQR